MSVRWMGSASRPTAFSRRVVGPLVALLVIWWEVHCRAFSVMSKTEDHDLLLKLLKEERARLETYMRTLRWPRLTHFQAFGKTYKLPLRSRLASKSPTAAELAYLGGFFDGDGCVTPVTGLSGCKLQITQVAMNAEVLILFRQFFGGGVYVCEHGKGRKRPTLKWVVCGGKARIAAKQLCQACLSKTEQLQLASNWPDDKDERQLVTSKLRGLKEGPPNIPTQSRLSWPYLTGLFDSDGCISLHSCRASFTLRLDQKYKPLLLQSKAFLDLMLGTSHVHVNFVSVTGTYQLAVCGQKTVHAVLQKFLNAGLTVKKSKAELALSLPENSEETIREQMSGITTTGNQGRHNKLDAEGRQLAKLIKGLQNRKWHAEKNDDSKLVEQLESKLECLQLHREIEKAKCCVHRLTEDIHKLVAQGAISTKPHLAKMLGIDFN
ncbi:unnamed protein product [Durusdinium trenchii]|uniref:LAGLIDADG endonuclease n=1 Tax=Durusdinium trenchii TaxID=1381693 RepID=A0ABP0N2U8_9DINO